MVLDLHVGKSVTRGPLTLFAVWNGHAVTRRSYDMGADSVQVNERAGQPSVGELVVTNWTPRAVLILEGELLEGGFQHRVAARSAIFPAGESVVLEVRCIEEGRWSGSSIHRRGQRRAPASIRIARSQQDTWARIRRFEDRHGEGNETHFLGDALSSVSDHAAELVAGLAPLPYQTGVLIGIGGYPMQLEVFDNARTLAETWDVLLHAAAIDAVGAEPIGTPGYRARRFAEQTSALSLAWEGDLVAERRSSDAVLTGLSWRGRTVHAVAFNPRHERVRT